MTLELYFSGASPFVRKVDVLLREAGLREQVTNIPVHNTILEPNEDVARTNPVGKVPALVRDDGPALYDSRVICRFIDSMASRDFYPESRLLEVLTLEATADGILEAALFIVYEHRLRPETKHHTPILDGQWLKVTRSLDALENRWMSHLQGPLTMVQIAIGCALGYLDFRHGDRDWRNGRPQLDEWFKSFADRPSMQATVPTG